MSDEDRERYLTDEEVHQRIAELGDPPATDDDAGETRIRVQRRLTDEERAESSSVAARPRFRFALGADGTYAIDDWIAEIGRLILSKSRHELESIINHPQFAPLNDPRIHCIAWMHAASLVALDMLQCASSAGAIDPSYSTPTISIYEATSDHCRVCVDTRFDEGLTRGAIILARFGGDACGACIPCVSLDNVMKRAAANWVYFICAGQGGPIKIGRSNNVESRLSGFQTGHYEELRVLLRIPGGAAVESMLHSRFEKDRRRGEWFNASPELLALIDELKGSRRA